MGLAVLAVLAVRIDQGRGTLGAAIRGRLSLVFGSEMGSGTSKSGETASFGTVKPDSSMAWPVLATPTSHRLSPALSHPACTRIRIYFSACSRQAYMMHSRIRRTPPAPILTRCMGLVEGLLQLRWALAV